MLRADPASRHKIKSRRALNFEPLEHRAMLSATAGGATVPVITFMAKHEMNDIWDLEGTVTDQGASVAGMKVTFGGVLAKYGVTATVLANGSYCATEPLPNVATGTATAKTQVAGMASNTAMSFLLNDNPGVTVNRTTPPSAPTLPVLAHQGLPGKLNPVLVDTFFRHG
jgi:hypothetical protein